MIDWHSVDAESAFLVLSNLYVAAQMMWNPQRSGAQLLREFTRGMFGSENEEKMASVYDAVEIVYPTLVRLYTDPGLTDLDKAPARLARLEAAQKTLESVRIAPHFVPAFPLIIQPAEMIQEIRAQLDTLHTYLEFQVGASRLRAMKEGEANKQRLTQELNLLPKVPPSEEYLWDGVYKRYQGRLSALRQQLGLSQ